MASLEESMDTWDISTGETSLAQALGNTKFLVLII